MLDRPVWAEVDLDAFSKNVKGVKALLKPGVRFCAVVKADGYGHGAVPVAREALASGADMLAVAIMAEAQDLRRAGFTVPILILGYSGPEFASRAAAMDITIAVFDLATARAYSDAGLAAGKRIKLHIKVDTGMGRLGLSPGEAGELAAAIASLPGVELEGLFSHFSSADSADLGYAREQLGRFREAVAAIEARGIRIPLKHMANSAASLVLPEAQFDMVRPGIVLYGLAPSGEMNTDFHFHPAMSLKARLSMVKRVPEGTSIGYGRAFITKRPSAIATIPLGYADGWPRALGHGAVSIGLAAGRAPIVGRVCMDQCMADVSDLGGARAGEVATLFGGSGPSIDDIARALDTINYEVVCMIGKRVPRLYCRGESRA